MSYSGASLLYAFQNRVRAADITRDAGGNCGILQQGMDLLLDDDELHHEGSVVIRTRGKRTHKPAYLVSWRSGLGTEM